MLAPLALVASTAEIVSVSPSASVSLARRVAASIVSAVSSSVAGPLMSRGVPSALKMRALTPQSLVSPCCGSSGLPRDDKSAARQRRDAGSPLTIIRQFIDEEFRDGFCPIRIEDARLDASAADIALLWVKGVPRHDKSAALQRRDAGRPLIIIRQFIDEEFRDGFGPIRIENARLDAVTAGIALLWVIRLPRDDKSAALKRCDAGVSLIIIRQFIDEEFRDGFCPIRIEDARLDAPNAAGIALLWVIRLPRDDKSAALKRGDAGCNLIIIRKFIDEEFRDRFGPIRIENARLDASIAGYRPVVGQSDRHVTTKPPPSSAVMLGPH